MRPGTARLHTTEPWTLNPSGSRTLEEALAIARRHGIEIPEDLRFQVFDEFVYEGAYATYAAGLMVGPSGENLVEWKEFYSPAGVIPVNVRTDVLMSDEAILAVFAHEAYELNALRKLFAESGGRMTASRLNELIRADVSVPGNLHDLAVADGDRRVLLMRTKS